MEKNTYYVYSDELYHYGRKGMKWGQNIFGKPKSGSKGRVVAKKKSLLDKAKEAQAAKKKAKADAAEAERKKDPRNMSDADLRKAIDRKRLENEYRQYYPAKVSRGKKFVAKFLDESLTPALVSSGKKFMTDAFDAIGKNVLEKYTKTEPTEQQKLDKELKKVEAQSKILEYKNKIKKAKSGGSSLEDQAEEAKLQKAIEDALKAKYERKKTEETWKKEHPDEDD